jgi:hypothetical protein
MTAARSSIIKVVKTQKMVLTFGGLRGHSMGALCRHIAKDARDYHSQLVQRLRRWGRGGVSLPRDTHSSKKR